MKEPSSLNDTPSPFLVDDASDIDPESIGNAIQNLEQTLSALPLSDGAISHYRHIPTPVQEIYDTLIPAAQLISSTATKYALMARDGNDGPPPEYARDLLRGARILVAACFFFQTPAAAGGSLSLQRHTRKAVRAILRAVVTFYGDPSAPHTGVVWDACQGLEQNMPRGNRNAMRRDLFTYLRECQETIREFQTLLDDSVEEDDDDDHYTSAELPVARASWGLLNCSRGMLKATMEIMDHLDKSTASPALSSSSINSSNDDTNDEEHCWHAIVMLHNRVATVGYGVTDLGAALYPPLLLGSEDTVISCEVQRQAQALRQLLQYILEDVQPRYGLLDPVWETVQKIQTAVEVRTAEVQQGIASAAVQETLPNKNDSTTTGR